MKHVFPNRKDNIILTAIEIISDLGIQGLSTKELAKRQEITESLLYRYFRSKDEIIIAVLENFSRFDLSIRRTVSNSSGSSKEKIMEYFRLYAEYYENYPDITAIMLSFNELRYDPNTREMITDIYFTRNNFLSEMVQIGQKNGEIAFYYTTEELSEVLTGFFKNLTLTWKMKGYSFTLKEHTLTTVKKLLDQCNT